MDIEKEGNRRNIKSVKETENEREARAEAGATEAETSVSNFFEKDAWQEACVSKCMGITGGVRLGKSLECMQKESTEAPVSIRCWEQRRPSP